jgi:hypothetical protein
MKTLLEVAQNTPSKRRLVGEIEADEYELIFAWLRGELNSGQVLAAYRSRSPRMGGGGLAYRLARVLRAAYQKGKVIIKK